jgi:hypothetical protein
MSEVDILTNEINQFLSMKLGSDILIPILYELYEKYPEALIDGHDGIRLVTDNIAPVVLRHIRDYIKDRVSKINS